MIKNKPIYAFIDSQNLHLGTKSQGWKLNFGKFRVLLKEKYGVGEAFLFIGYIPKNRKLYATLNEAGYTIIFKPVVEPNNKHRKTKIKGNVDAELVLHSMINYPKYRQAVIVSGDGDFYCLVEYLASKNKLKKIIVPNSRYSSLLRKFGSYIVNIGLFKEKVRR